MGSMDEMNLVTKFARGIASKIITSLARKKLGYDVDVYVNALNVKMSEEKAHVHLDIDAQLTTEEVQRILKTLGLG